MKASEKIKYQVVGLLLAGGRSRRMHQDKGFIEWNGDSFVQHAYNVLNPLCHAVFVSAGDNNFTRYAALQIPVIKDELADRGPLGGMYSVMRAVKSEWYFVVSVDSPGLTGSLLRHLWEVRGHQQAIIVTCGNQVFPLIGLYHYSVLPVIAHQLMESSWKVGAVLEKIRVGFVEVPNDNGLNINTPEQLNGWKNES